MQTSVRMLEGRLLEGPPAWAATLHKVRAATGVRLVGASFNDANAMPSRPCAPPAHRKLRELKRRDLQGLCSQMRQLLLEGPGLHGDVVTHLERAVHGIASGSLQAT